MRWLCPGLCSMSSEFKIVTLLLRSNALASFSAPKTGQWWQSLPPDFADLKKKIAKEDRTRALPWCSLSFLLTGEGVWTASSTSTYLFSSSPTRCSPSTHISFPLLTDTQALHLDLNTAMVNKSRWFQSRAKAMKGRGKPLTGWNRLDLAPQEALLKQLLPCLFRVPRSNAYGRIQHSWWKWHCLLVIGGHT